MRSDSTASYDPTRARLATSFSDYREDRIEILAGNFAGATHLTATRKGLYALNEKDWVHLAHGFFFGMALRDDEVFAFEACDLPYSPLRMGRVVRFVRQGESFVSANVVTKGLDSGCHGMDFCDGRLHVVDTYNQQIVRLLAGGVGFDVLSPLPTPPYGRWANTDPRYVHANSILKVGNMFLLLLHNMFEHSGRFSEIAVFNKAWELVAQHPLRGRNCHGLALLEDGTVLSCDSSAGDLISLQGLRIPVSSQFTRGLAVGEDGIAVGSSTREQRGDRLRSSGTVTFMDRNYCVRSVIELPGAPMELRRLDGEDCGLSSYLETMSWGARIA